jgi:UDP-N-acetylglucosamine 1-carboxyvinyltransferase
MEKFVIEGPTNLKGEVKISGSKNAALPIIAATILAEGKFIIKNIPEITDIKNLLNIIEKLGATTKLENNICEIDTTKINSTSPDPQKVQNIRASILLAGPLLSRFGRVKLAHPGGCLIGARPVKTHFDAFIELGATIESNEEYYEIEAKNLIGEKIILGEFSVTGTENAIMIALSAKGITEIHLCANEPHVTDFCQFLISMGAEIEGLGTHTIIVHGQNKLHETSYKIIPDQIEAGTFILAAAAARGEVLVRNFIAEHHDILIKKLYDANINFQVINSDKILIKPTTTIKPINIRTDIYPGFPTDLQAPFTVLLTQAEGSSEIYETMFEDRLNYINELNKMGANGVIRSSHEATITGPTPLYGTTIDSLDLRSGATLIMAALIAEGKSVIEGADVIDRGYENIEEKFNKLGANITRVTE